MEHILFSNKTESFVREIHFFSTIRSNDRTMKLSLISRFLDIHSKPAPPVEKKEDNLEDSEVLKMLRSSNISGESTGLRRTDHGRRISRGSDNNDEGKFIYREF